jgi:hypothetical protein
MEGDLPALFEDFHNSLRAFPTVLGLSHLFDGFPT